MTATEALRVGGREVPLERARNWVGDYLNGEPGQYGYPSYDGYRTNNDPDRLCHGDLLAPALLNVQMKIVSFADLWARREEIDGALVSVPNDVELASADDDVLARVGRLYTVLDPGSDRQPRSVRGTKLSKVLHRKKPGLIPLYDRNIRRVYQDGDAAPVPPEKGRSWVEFMTQLAAAMREDLNRCPEVWDELQNLRTAEGPPVTSLRALDIVGWHLGK